MNQAFRAYFRSPDSVADFRLGGELQKESGFFRFGAGIDCYGQCSVRQPVTNYRAHLEDVSFATKIDRRHVTLPFDPNQVAENLRLEAYTGQMHAEHTYFGGNAVIRAIYYLGRPAFPVHFRRILQRIRLQGGTQSPFPHWPVDRTVDRLFEELMKAAFESEE